MKKECNSLVRHYPVGCTDALQSIDAGLGALMKVEVGKQLDIWLENRDNLERWESNALTASDRRVLLTKWVATAVEIVDYRPKPTTGFACSRRQGASRRRTEHVMSKSTSRGRERGGRGRGWGEGR